MRLWGSFSALRGMPFTSRAEQARHAGLGSEVLRLMVADELDPSSGHRLKSMTDDVQNPHTVRTTIHQVADLNDNNLSVVGSVLNALQQLIHTPTDVTDQHDSPGRSASTR